MTGRARSGTSKRHRRPTGIRYLIAALAAVVLAAPAAKAHPRHYRWWSAVASEYGDGDGQLGGPLACGGRYTPGMLGVASKTLRCGTRLRVCLHWHCVTVTVMDRGPYIPGRSFDLMIRPAAVIGFSGVGTIRWRFA